jgi:hypothetical protein
MNSPLRDIRIGKRIAYSGGARILTEAEQCLTNQQRLDRWKELRKRLEAIHRRAKGFSRGECAG